MRRIFWMALILLTVLALVDSGQAQPPGGKKGGFGKGGFGKGFPETVTIERMVERILTFDKDKDGKITADELPERMQHLIAMGDTNKDGVLNRDEVSKLATTLDALAGIGLGGGPGFKGKGKGKGFDGIFAGPESSAQRALDDLNLSEPMRKKAAGVIRAHEEKVRKLQDQAREELLGQMKEILSEGDFSSFKTALERQPGRPFGGFKKGPRP
ncbi:MAG: EF-hand domain-containing protein [Gemmataceae bacterium]|nr:EF-hand domain-containing protein [Gemmataceae bacterium]